MEKTKYKFSHFIIVDGHKKEIDPYKDAEISSQCKLFWTNITTGNEHVIVAKAAQ